MISKLIIICSTVYVIKAAQLKGENPFLAAINSTHYIDKTGFVEYFHDTFVSPVFFTAPPGFGKTTNLHMLRAFYEINTSENGETVRKEETDNYKAFQKVKNITTARASRTLMDEDKFFHSNFGSQPVIHLSFKDIHHDRFEVFMNSLKWLIIREFKAHPYLNDSKKLSSEEKALFGKFFNSESEVRGDKIIENSGGTLAKLLSKHFGKPCLLLIDDYDEPIIKVFTDGSADVEHIVQRLQTFMKEILLDKNVVSRAFLTGKTRLAGMYTPSCVKHYQFGLHAGITRFFGVRVTEARALKTKNSLELYKLNLIFKGFTITNSNYSHSMFDPVSISEFLDGREHARILEPVEFLEPILEDRGVRDKLELAIRRDRISITAPKETEHDKCVVTLGKIFKYGQDLVDHANYGEYNDAYDAFNSKLELEDADRNCLFYYLFELGYFTVPANYETHLTLSLPDAAAYDTLSAQLERFWVSHLHTTNVTARNFVAAFMGLTYKNDTLDAFANSVVNVFKESPHRPTSEANLRSPLFTFLATRVQQYPALELRCGEDPRDGWVDLQAVIQRKDHSKKGVVLEFMHSNCSLEGAAAIIRTKRHWERFKSVNDENKDVKRYIGIGVCLSEKDEFDFTFIYTSEKHDNTYNVSRKVKGWRSKKKKEKHS